MMEAAAVTTATTLKTFDLSVPLAAGSLDSYISSVNQLPMLSLEREQELAQRFQESGDLDAARELVMSHLRFVVKIARGYAGYGLAHGDLIQEGNIGLMKAVKRFDPTVGVRLVSFAVHWVKAEIHEFILRNWRIVKVATTKAQRKLFFNLRSGKKSLGWMGAEEAEAMASELGVSKQDVMTMEQRLHAHDMAFDLNPAQEDESNAPATFLEDLRFEPASALEEDEHSTMQVENLRQAVETLDDRARDIIVSRWLTEPKATLHELADRYGVSAERIRQLEKSAFGKIRNALASAAA